MADLSFFDRILEYLGSLPPLLVYLVVGTGAAIENFFPPVPADTFVLVGAFVSEQGRAAPLGVFVVTWLFNVGSALAVYRLGRDWGPGFFTTPMGHWLLRPRQLDRIAALYERHGFKVVFASRFLPGFRAVVPVFAGVSLLGFWRTSIPLGLASAIWYGLLVYLGTMASRHWDLILGVFSNVNAVLLIIAILLAAFLAILWWRTRHHPDPSQTGGGEL